MGFAHKGAQGQEPERYPVSVLSLPSAPVSAIHAGPAASACGTHPTDASVAQLAAVVFGVPSRATVIGSGPPPFPRGACAGTGPTRAGLADGTRSR